MVGIHGMLDVLWELGIICGVKKEGLDLKVQLDLALVDKVHKALHPDLGFLKGRFRPAEVVFDLLIQERSEGRHLNGNLVVDQN